ncbi:LamG-like jellyroll fold domain-containing protein [Zavarzinella formosa]|uniref:LamG-like jellyroll fold domain-containing protein n=1 Tax=Zavarzinella formosa TaxID=360055 RepID=UPI0002DA4A3A|nr:LamG-like jellyroll fold domain-containing protein [Zavarzinella formosa]
MARRRTSVLSQMFRQRKNSADPIAKLFALKLRLQELEDRSNPAIVTWDGGAGTFNWTDPANWDTDRLPTADDDVVLATERAFVDITNSAAVTVKSLTSIQPLEVDVGASLNVLEDAALDNSIYVSGSFSTGGDVHLLPYDSADNRRGDIEQFGANGPVTVGQDLISQGFVADPNLHVLGNFTNRGSISSSLTVDGDFTQVSGGGISEYLNADGVTPPSPTLVITVGGTATLAGQLYVDFNTNKPVVTSADAFTILNASQVTGAFDSVILPMRRNQDFVTLDQSGASLALQGHDVSDAPVTWDGGAGTLNWGDAQNWDTDGLPGQYDTVVIGALGTPDPVVLNIGEAQIISLVTDQRLQINGDLNTRESEFNAGLDLGAYASLYVANNSLVLKDHSSLGDYASISDNSGDGIVINSGDTLTVGTGSRIDGNLHNSGTITGGYLFANGNDENTATGQIRLTDTGMFSQMDNAGIIAAPTMTFQGGVTNSGTITANAITAEALESSGQVTTDTLVLPYDRLEIDDGTVTAQTVDVQNSDLYLNSPGELHAASVTVARDAYISGDLTAPSVTVANNAFVNSELTTQSLVANNLIMESGSILRGRILGPVAGTDYLQVNVADKLTIFGGDLELRYAGGGYLPVAGDHFDVLTYGSKTGDFDKITVSQKRGVSLLTPAPGDTVYRFDAVTAPAGAVTWDGGAGTFNWFDAKNWDDDIVPGDLDDVVIPDLPGTPTIRIEPIQNSGMTNPTVSITNLTTNEALAIDWGTTVEVGHAPVFNSDVTLGTDSSLIIDNASSLDISKNLVIGTNSKVQLTAAGASLNVTASGKLAGEGTIKANVANAGTVSPGGWAADTARLTVDGNYTQASTGILAVELAGTDSQAANYDQLAVTGTASVDGTLTASFIHEYVALPNDVYTVLASPTIIGSFATVSVPQEGAANYLTTGTNASGFTLTGASVLNTYTVTSTDDDGPGTLRDAIATANATPGRTLIAFNIPGAGTHTIYLSSGGLPIIYASVIIAGETQPGYAGEPLIELNGSQDAINSALIFSSSSHSSVSGLVIDQFTGIAIGAYSGAGLRITGNRIGTAPSGDRFLPGTLAYLPGESVSTDRTGNLTGGSATGEYSYSSGKVGKDFSFDGSAGAGLDFSQGADTVQPTDAVTVETWVRSSIQQPGKWIIAKGADEDDAPSYGLTTGAAGGLLFQVTTADGTFASPDAGSALWDGAWHHVVGSYNRATGLARLIVDGTEVGTGTPGSGLIKYGLAKSDDLVLGNSPGDTDSPFQGDLDELSIYGRELSSEEIQTIISRANGGKAKGFGNGSGIFLFDVSSAFVGDIGIQNQNLISDNQGTGIFYSGMNGLTIQNNLIGTDRTGTQDYHNAGDAQIQSYGNPSSNILIGGPAVSQRNVIVTGNGVSDGVSNGRGIYMEYSSNVEISNNYIATNITGTKSLGTQATDIYAFSVNGLRIGRPHAGNLMSGAMGYNEFEISTIQDFVVQGNTFGYLADRFLQPTDGNITFNGTPGFLLGGSDYGDGNSGRGDASFFNADGGSVLGNSFTIVNMAGGSKNVVVGGTHVAEQNTLSYLTLTDLDTTGNKIYGNQIFQLQAINGAHDNQIGGSLPGQGNTIQYLSLGSPGNNRPSLIETWLPGDGNASDSNDQYTGFSGTTYGSLTYAPGIHNQGFLFAGSGGIVEHPSPYEDRTAGIDAWVRLDQLPAVGTNATILTQNNPGASEDYGLYVTNDGGVPKLRLRWTYQGTAYAVDSDAIPLLDGQIHHVAVSFDGTTVTFYHNGQILSSAPQPAAQDRLSVGGLYRVGASARDANTGEISEPFIGLIDEPATYIDYNGDTLDESMVKDIYNDRGVDKGGDGTRANTVQGNTIIHDADISESPENIIGGSGVGEGNLFQGHLNINSPASQHNIVQGNVFQATTFGFSQTGVFISVGAKNNTVGGTAPGDGNVFHIDRYGVVVDEQFGGNTSGNSIIGNTYPIAFPGSVPIVLQDGGNNSEPVPTLDFVLGGDNGLISGSVIGDPSTDYRIDINGGPASDPYSLNFGSFVVHTDSTGAVAFKHNIPSSVPFGSVLAISSTNLTTGNTSAFTGAKTAVAAILLGIPARAKEGDHIELTAFTSASTPQNGLAYNWTILKDGQPYQSDSDEQTLHPTTAGIVFTPDDNGVYTVSLEITTLNGMKATLGPIDIPVSNQLPNGEYTQVVHTTAAGTPVTFQGTATDPGKLDQSSLTYAWEVRAGTPTGPMVFTGTGPEITFTPTLGNLHFVTMIVTDKDGGVERMPARVLDVTGGDSVASIVVTPDGPEGAPVRAHAQLSDLVRSQAVTYTWSVLKDGAPYSSFTIPSDGWMEFVPDDNGVYQVGLTLTVAGAASAAVPKIVVVSNERPTPSIKGISNQISLGQTVNALADVVDPGKADTATPDKMSLLWQWKRIDSPGVQPVQSGTDTQFPITPTDPGIYELSLTATDKDGGSKRIDKLVRVVGDQLTVSLGIPAGPFVQGSSYSLTPTVTGGAGPYQSAWTITDRFGRTVASSTAGDYTSVLAAFSFLPPSPGSYTLRLLVRSQSGLTGLIEGHVNVANAPPLASLAVDPADAPYQEGKAIHVKLTTKDPGGASPVFVQWQVNGSPVTNPGKDPTVYVFTPPDNGSYVVSAVVSDPDGGVTTAQLNLNVANVAPTVDPLPDVSVTSKDTKIVFSAKAADPGINDTFTYAWTATRNGISLPGGSAATFSVPITTAGTFLVRVTVTDKDGGATTRSIAFVLGSNAADTIKVTPAMFASAPADRYAVFARAGNDRVSVDPAFAFPVYIDGGEGNDTIVGGAKGDVLVAGPGNNSVSGGAGDDTIYGGGSDTLDGGAGVGDRLIPHFSNITLLDPDGATVSLEQAPTGVTLDLGQQAGQHQPVFVFNNIASYITMTGVFDAIEGSPYQDSLTTSIANTSLLGGGGDDHLASTIASGVILDGGDGNDQLTVGGTNNTITGGDGNDQISVSGSGNTVTGDGGDNTIILNPGTDGGVVGGGDGNNTIIGNGVTDTTILGGDGDDTIDLDSSSGTQIETTPTAPADPSSPSDPLGGGLVFGRGLPGSKRTDVNLNATEDISIFGSDTHKMIVSARQSGNVDVFATGRDDVTFDSVTAGTINTDAFGAARDLAPDEQSTVIVRTSTDVSVFGSAQRPTTLTASDSDRVTVYAGPADVIELDNVRETDVRTGVLGDDSPSADKTTVNVKTSNDVRVFGTDDQPLKVAVSDSDSVDVFGGSGLDVSFDKVTASAVVVDTFGAAAPQPGLAKVAVQNSDGVGVFGTNDRDLQVTADNSSNVDVFGGDGASVTYQQVAGGSVTINELGASRPGASRPTVVVTGSQDVSLFGSDAQSPEFSADHSTNIDVFGGSGTDVNFDTVTGGKIVIDSLGSLLPQTGDAHVNLSASQDVSVFGGTNRTMTVNATGVSKNIVVFAQDTDLVSFDHVSGGIIVVDSLGLPLPSARNEGVTITDADTIRLFGIGDAANQVNITNSTDIQAFAGGGDDSLTVTGGSDVEAAGDAGNDTLTVNSGDNIIVYGGDGADVFHMDGGVSAIAVGGAGDDQFNISGGDSPIVFGGLDQNSYVITGGTNPYAIGGNSGEHFTVTGGNNAAVSAGGGDDTITASGNPDNFTGVTALDGSDGNDVTTISDNLNDVYAFGADGDDQLTATAGLRVNLYGEDGNDTTSFLAGSQLRASGGAGNDTMTTSSSGDNILLIGGNDADNIQVNAGQTVTAYGLDGADTINVADGNDVEAIGGADADTLSIAGGTGISAFGESGDDNLSVSGGTSLLLAGGAGSDQLTVVGGANVLAFGETGTDTLTASGGSKVTLSGGDGQDTLSSTTSEAELYGDDSDDTYKLQLTPTPLDLRIHELLVLPDGSFEAPSRGSDTIDLSGITGVGATLDLGQPGDDTLPDGGLQSVVPGRLRVALFGTFENIIGTDSADFLQGDAADNHIQGNGGNDTIIGLAGNDTLEGGAGDDTLNGGAGNDQYPFNDTPAVVGGPRLSLGSDTIIEPSDTDEDSLDFSQFGSAVTVDLSSTTTQTVAPNLAITLDNASGIEDVAGSDFDDSLSGNARDNRLTGGKGNDTLAGRAGNDTYVFAGSQLGSDTVNEVSDQDSDTLDFAEFDGPANVNLSLTTPQVFGPDLTLTLGDGEGLENVVGTGYSDSITGNDRDNHLTGGGGADTIRGGAGNDYLQAGFTQVVFLDFVSGTDAARGDYVYTIAEQNAILANLNAKFAGFDYVFTNDRDAAKLATEATGGEFDTLVFNAGPGGGVGGEADEIDFRNLRHTNTGSVNIQPLLSYLDGVPGDREALIINLTATVAAHEIGHMAGLRHADSFGPIGSGIPARVDPTLYFPTYVGPMQADESQLHVMASPLAVGSTIADAAQDTFFGEREDIKLAFNEVGRTIFETNTDGDSHDSAATAEPLGVLPSLTVPNTLRGESQNAGKQFNVSALAVIGHVVVTNGVSEQDVYSLTGKAGDLMNFELISESLNPSRGQPFDGVLTLRDAAGNVIATNDDEYEGTRDASIIDAKLPADGVYFIEVAPYFNGDGGRYELFMSRFATGVASRATGDDLAGGSGSDTSVGGLGDDIFRKSDSLASDLDVFLGGGGQNILDETGGADGGHDTLANITFVKAASIAPVAGQSSMTFNLTEGNLFEHQTPFTIADGDSLTYRIMPDGGNPLPSGIGVDNNGLVRWLPSRGGDFSATVIATDSLGESATYQMTFHVADVAPVVTATGASHVQEGKTWTGSGQFTDPGVNVWTATVDYGDGQGAQPVALSADGKFKLSHLYPNSGVKTVTVRVFDGILTGQTTLQVTVDNVNPNGVLTNSGPITQGQPLSVSVGNLTDPSPADLAGLTFSYDFDNDGTPDVVGSTQTTMVVPANKLPAGHSTATIRVRVSDPDGGFTDLFTQASVYNVAPSVTTGTGQTVVAGNTVHLSASASDPGNDIVSRTWTITNTATNAIVATGSGDTFDYVPAKAGNFVATIAVKDAFGAAATASQNLTVKLLPPTGTVANSGPVTEGSLATVKLTPADPTRPLHYAFDFDNDGIFDLGDGLTYAGSVASNSATLPATLTANGPASRPVRIRVIDDNNQFTEYSTTVSVVNAAPTVSISSPATAPVGKPVQFTLFGNDPSPVDAAANLTFRIDWNNDGVFDETVVGPSGTVVPHTFSVADDVEFSVIAIDQDGGKSEAVTASVYVGDPPPAVRGTVSIVKGDLVIVGTKYNDRIHITPGGTPGSVMVSDNGVMFGPYLPTGIIRISGGYGNDVITIDRRVTVAARIDGSYGNDLIRGGAGGDTLIGNIGNDSLDGGAGNDSLDGGTGNDTLTGDAGIDTFNGGAGTDLLVESADASMILSQGTARINGALSIGAETDVLYRTTIETAVLTGGDGNNTINAAAFSGKVTLIGGAGNDILTGGAGNDVLIGGTGNDFLTGNNGRDLLIGGMGADSLAGGLGDDLLIAGSTIHDENLAAIDGIMAEWTSARVYTTRIGQLTGTIAKGLNKTFLLTAATVQNDHVTDILAGGTGGLNRDWFVTSLGDVVTDLTTTPKTIIETRTDF